MRHVVAFAAAVALAGQAPAQEEERLVAAVAAAAKRYLASECAFARGKMVEPDPRPFQREAAGSIAKMSCDCMPGEVDRVALELGAGKDGATTTQAAFMERVKLAMVACSARILKAEIQERCEAEKDDVHGVPDKKAYCGCVAAKVRAMDDSTVAAAASAAHRRLQERARARAAGKPEPGKVATVVEEALEACKTGG